MLLQSETHTKTDTAEEGKQDNDRKKVKKQKSVANKKVSEKKHDIAKQVRFV